MSRRPFRIIRQRETREAPRAPMNAALLKRVWDLTLPYARRRNQLFALTILRAIQLPMLAWTVGKILSGPIARHDTRGTLWGVAGFAALLLFTELVFAVRIRYAFELGEDIVQDLRRKVHHHVLSMPMSFFAHMPLGRLLSRATSDVETIRLGIQDAVFVGVVQLGSMLAAALLMLWQDPILFALVSVLVPVLWLLIRYFHGRLFAAHTAMHESFSRVTATLAETVTGVRAIQGFGREKAAEEAFRELIEDHARFNLQVSEQNAVFAPLAELNGQLFLAMLVVAGGYRALTGHSDLGTLVHFFFLAAIFFNPIPVLAMQYNQALSAMAGAERVFRLLDTPRDWDDPADALSLDVVQGKVQLVDVVFGYDPNVPVLKNVSFTAQPGQTVAIVGETGGGKSTILALIAKMFLPTSGQVLIDDQDLMGVTRTSLRRQMGLVQQANFLWTGTVMQNIRYGKPSATDDEVVAATQSLGVRDMIEALPNGFQTEVGERGASLSLGQRQIVCFARAMLADPRILLLDEATSAIDTVTEARIQHALRRLLEGRTSFVVAHRLSTVRHADQVLVVAHGKVVDQGTFASLAKGNSEFAELAARTLEA